MKPQCQHLESASGTEQTRCRTIASVRATARIVSDSKLYMEITLEPTVSLNRTEEPMRAEHKPRMEDTKDTTQFIENWRHNLAPQLQPPRAGVRLGWPRPKKEKLQGVAWAACSQLVCCRAVKTPKSGRGVAVTGWWRPGWRWSGTTVTIAKQPDS